MKGKYFWQLTDRIREKQVFSLLGSRSSSSTLSSVVNSLFFHSTFASPICSTWIFTD